MRIAFPALTLRLSHGRYGFPKRLKLNQFVLYSSLTAPVELNVLFTGTVARRTLITGTGQDHRLSARVDGQVLGRTDERACRFRSVGRTLPAD